MTEQGAVVPPRTEEDVLRVKASSNPQALAAAIAHACYDGQSPILRAVGAGAVNQAVKACVIARQYVASRAQDLSIRPGFATVQMPDGEVSAIILRVSVD